MVLFLLLSLCLSISGYIVACFCRSIGLRTQTAFLFTAGLLVLPLFGLLPSPATDKVIKVDLAVLDLPHLQPLLLSVGLISLCLIIREFVIFTNLELRFAKQDLEIFGAHGAHNVYLVDHIRSPCLIGLLRPKVLLPVSARDWDEVIVRQVLAHEFAHLKRADPWRLLISRLNRALNWWNPFAHLLHRELVLECEIHSDACSSQCSSSPQEYLRTLCDLAENSAEAPALAFAQQSSLEARVRFLLKPERKGKVIVLLMSILLISCAFAIATLSARNANLPVELSEIELRLTAQPFSELE